MTKKEKILIATLASIIGIFSLLMLAWEAINIALLDFLVDDRFRIKFAIYSSTLIHVISLIYFSYLIIRERKNIKRLIELVKIGVVLSILIFSVSNAYTEAIGMFIDLIKSIGIIN